MPPCIGLVVVMLTMPTARDTGAPSDQIGSARLRSWSITIISERATRDTCTCPFVYILMYTYIYPFGVCRRRYAVRVTDSARARLVLYQVHNSDEVIVKRSNTLQYSCEIEDFIETHVCKPCVILRSRDCAYYWVCVLIEDIGGGLAP